MKKHIPNIWRPIEEMPKTIKKGYIRIYSFKPSIHKHRFYCNLSRMYRFEPYAGAREIDKFMDILEVQE